MSTDEPTGDQSWCDVGDHAPRCSGYTENWLDPETCDCNCHDDIQGLNC